MFSNFLNAIQLECTVANYDDNKKDISFFIADRYFLITLNGREK